MNGWSAKNICGRAHGTSLIEVLVALTIMALTAVSIGMMLTESLRSMNAALNRQRAVRLAADLGEMLSGLSQRQSITVTSGNDFGCGPLTLCSPSEFLGHSVHRWRSRTAQLLPAGYGTYTLESIDELAVVNIAIGWRSAGGQQQTHSVQVPLRRSP